MKKFIISWPSLNINLKAELLDSLNPILANEFWVSLPLKGIQDHALISGEYLYGYIDLPILCSSCHNNVETKEPRTNQNIGRINVSILQHFSIKYGAVTEYLDASPIGQIFPGGS